MTRLSPKIEIINHFDNLINKIDIDIDNCLQKYNDQQLISELLKSSQNNRRNFKNHFENFNIKFFRKFNISKPQSSLDLCTESTKVIDYLKQIRMKAIEELRKAEEDTFEYYKLNFSRFKSELSNEKIDELRSKLFAENFYFQVHFTQSEKRCWAFNVFTFVTDFYMSPSDIDSLEKLINDVKEPFDRNSVFDDKTILIGLLYKYFIVNLFNFPNHLIRVCKQDVLNIESIRFNYECNGVNLTSSSAIDMSKLCDLNLLGGNSINHRECLKINIEGLSSLKSLHLGLKSTEMFFSIRNLSSLNFLSLSTSGTIDENIITQLLDQVQHIQQLFLNGKFSYFKLDNLLNLKMLSLVGTLNEDFNYELFKNLCYQLRDLELILKNIDDTIFFKLFDGHNFCNLENFSIREYNMKTLKKEFINRFPMLQQLFVADCNIEEIEHDAFSDLKDLYCLDLSENRIKFIEKDTFLNLKNLQVLDLSKNKLKNVDAYFIGARNYMLDIFFEENSFGTFNFFWYNHK